MLKSSQMKILYLNLKLIVMTDDDEVISNIIKKSISIKNSLNTTGILKKVKQNIFNALIYYWNIPSNLGLIAALLDPRYKNLNFLKVDAEKE